MFPHFFGGAAQCDANVTVNYFPSDIKGTVAVMPPGLRRRTYHCLVSRRCRTRTVCVLSWLMIFNLPFATPRVTGTLSILNIACHEVGSLSTASNIIYRTMENIFRQTHKDCCDCALWPAYHCLVSRRCCMRAVCVLSWL